MVTSEQGRGSDNDDKDSEHIDWDVLKKQELVIEGTYIRHVRFRDKFTLKVDGTTSEAIGFLTEEGS